MSRPAPPRRGTTAGPRNSRSSNEPSTSKGLSQHANRGLSLGTNLDVSSTVISTVTKNGGRRQARLEDLDTDALEHYSKDVVEMSLKRKITPRNAFDIKMIDCTYELLKRSDIPLTPDTGTTDEIKMYASRLETCGKIYGMRVENTRLYATDLTDDLERVAKGKRLKTKEKEDTEAEGTADEAEEVRESEGEKEAPEVEVQAVEVVVKRVKKNRKSRIIEDVEELACAETEINANFVSRYWSLIGNVQPGVMKDSWIHQGERIENADRLNFVMDPSLTCVQRYKHMLPPPTASDEDTRSASQRTVAKLKKQAVQAAEKGLLQIAQQLKLNQRLTVDSCVTFTKGQEKHIAKAEQSASEKVKRNYREAPEGTDNLEKKFHDCCSAAVDGSVHQLVEDDTQMEDEEEIESREIVPSKFNATFQVPLDPGSAETTDDFHGDTIVDDDEQEPAADRRTSEPPAENIPPIEDMDIPNNENAPENTGSEHSSDPFRFAGQNPPPRALSENRSVRAPSEAGSTTSHKSKKGRYGSVVQDVPAVVDKFALLGLDTTLASLKSLSKAEKNADFPETLSFTVEDFRRVMGLLARSKRNTTRTDSKEKLIRQLTKSPRKGDAPLITPSRSFIELPVGFTRFDPESIVNFLAVQTKALQKNLESVLTWLASTNEKGDNTDINREELVLACRRAYDEDFDPDLERLQRGWGNNDDNYSLSSEDISDLEDFADTVSSPVQPDASTATSPAPDDRSTSHMEMEPDLPPALDDFPTDPSTNPEKNNADAVVEDTAEIEGRVPTHPPGGGSPEQAVAGDAWRDLLAIPGNPRQQDLGILSVQDVRQAGVELVREDALHMLTEEDYAPETNFEFAENIALRDCTGSGVNIGKMKLAVQKTYLLLTKYRKRAWERGRGRHGAVMPYLRARHLMEWVYLMLDRKEHRHISPSVVFSCLLHLAYEKKLCLISPEDLADVYVLTADEMSAYTRIHPHLNRLTESYVEKLLKLPMPFSVAEPITTASQSSDLVGATDNLRPGRDAAHSDADSDESDTETASVVTSTTVTSRATSGLTSVGPQRRDMSVASSASRNVSVASSAGRNVSVASSAGRNVSVESIVALGSRKKRVRVEDAR